MKVDILEGLDPNRPRNSSDHLLVRELTHRINNEFASVIGRASLFAARSTNHEVKKALAAITRILYSSADVHRALQMPAHRKTIDVSEYIRTLCQSIARARLDDIGIELILVEDPIQMCSERCWKLGMIVSELITNSVRHAFDGRGGIIRIVLSSSGPYARRSVMDSLRVAIRDGAPSAARRDAHADSEGAQRQRI